MKILYVKSNPNPNSYTFKVSEKIIEDLKTKEAEVDTLDLYQAYPKFLNFTTDVTEEAQAHATKFTQYDAYVIAAPMWNFGIPAILKAYIDMIAQAGITFKYVDGKPVGLLDGKKLLFVSARGGDYSSDATKGYDFSGPYIRAIFNFLGLTDQKHIFIEGTAMGAGDTAVEKIITDHFTETVEYLSK